MGEGREELEFLRSLLALTVGNILHVMGVALCWESRLCVSDRGPILFFLNHEYLFETALF